MLAASSFPSPPPSSSSSSSSRINTAFSHSHAAAASQPSPSSKYHSLYFCYATMWVWEKEHCHECVEVRFPRHRFDDHQVLDELKDDQSWGISKSGGGGGGGKGGLVAMSPGTGADGGSSTPRHVLAKVSSTRQRSLSLENVLGDSSEEATTATATATPKKGAQESASSFSSPPKPTSSSSSSSSPFPPAAATVASSPFHAPKIGEEEGDENDEGKDGGEIQLWFCTSDLFVYDHEHCWNCEKFIVQRRGSIAERKLLEEEKGEIFNKSNNQQQDGNIQKHSVVAARDGKGSNLRAPIAVFGERGSSSSILASIFAKGVRIPFESIPVVDLSPLVMNRPDEDPLVLKTVAEIAHAVRNVGFMYVKNHGVDPQLKEKMFALSEKFFHLPLERKKQIDISKSSCHRGYFPLRGELLSTNGDLKEGLDIGMELSPDDPDILSGLPLHGPNQWPLRSNGGGNNNDNDNDDNEHPSSSIENNNEKKETDEEFRSTCLTYMSAASKLALTILRGFALALDLPPSFFAERCKKPMAALRFLHYPPQQASDLSADNVGCGAHTDYGCVTILAQDNIGGLQVWSGEKWVAAPPIEGTYVINTGDMMGMWTNEVFPPTIHRVINISGAERYSIPFFFNPDYRTRVECLPSCLRMGPEGTKRSLYPPVICGDHLNRRFDESFAYRLQKESVDGGGGGKDK